MIFNPGSEFSGNVSGDRGVDRGRVSDLIAWMIDGAPPGADAPDFVDGICRRLAAAGLPLDRFGLFVNTLHPNVAARRFLWTAAEGVSLGEGARSIFAEDQYLKNPIPAVISSHAAIRRRLYDPRALDEFIILRELRDEGFTDYLAQPLVFTTGETHVATFSTRHPLGFSDEHLAVLERVRQPLARLAESYLLRLNAAAILSTYVGRGSGEQIMKGRVHRGDGEEIAAAILFTDLIGFTELSNRLTGPQVVELLNDAFDVLVPPVEAHGGEILKFLGDGFFAIFPYGSTRPLEEAVKAASETIMEGESKLADTQLGKTLSFRSALHVGRFHYGNIGGANRLDFTAIGRPVNYAARLLSAASDLSLRRVASDDVSLHLCTLPTLAAEVEFKGFEGTQKIFAY